MNSRLTGAAVNGGDAAARYIEVTERRHLADYGYRPN
jgi:hypothetical protein